MEEKYLPQSMEAKEGVLGSLIIDPEAMGRVADFLAPEDFYRNAHRTLYAMILNLWERREPADYITLCDALEREGKLEDVGGAGSITFLINGVPTSGNIEYYGHIVAQKALYRRLIHVAGKIAAIAYEEADNALEQAEQHIFALGQRGTSADFSPLGTVLSACMDDLDAIHERRDTIIGIPTGFRHLDTVLGGLQRSDLIVLAGRPGSGKTSFALNIARNAAIDHRHHIAIFSLEMSKKQLGLRLLSMEAPIDQQRLRMGWVHDEEWNQIVSSMGPLSEGELWIDDTAGITLAALRSKARRLQTTHGIDLIIVDYLQLMHATQEGKRYQNREQEIAEISRGLKGIAKELHVPVLALAQLSRAVESRQSRVPQLSDLRESGAIENDADVVLFIYRDEQYNPETAVPKQAEIIIAKHRNGPVGSVLQGFEASQTRFYDIEDTPA
jgi:replicative DNA helicase